MRPLLEVPLSQRDQAAIKQCWKELYSDILDHRSMSAAAALGASQVSEWGAHRTIGHMGLWEARGCGKHWAVGSTGPLEARGRRKHGIVGSTGPLEARGRGKHRLLES